MNRHSRSTTPRVSTRRGGPLPGPGGALAGAAIAALGAAACGAALTACDFDWNKYDPRLSGGGGSPTSGGGTGGSGGVTGTGGTGSVSSGGTGGTGGVTESGGTGGTTTGGGGAGGTGGVLQPCGGTTLLRDDFEDGFTGVPWSWVSDPGVSVSEVGGEGVVMLPAGPAAYGAFQTKRYYDLRKDSVSVKVPSAAAASTAGTFLIARRDADNYVELSQKAGGLSCVKRVGGGYTLIATIAYVPAEHVHFRLRDDGNQVHCETSPDGAVFLPFASTLTSSLFDLSSVRIDIGARLDAAAAAASEAHFDDVNGGGVSPGKWCPASALTDDFDDGVKERSWLRSYDGGPGGCSMAKASGELVFTSPAGQTSYCARMSSSSYDLTGGEVLVSVPQISDATTSAEVFLRLEVEGKGNLEMTQTLGQLTFRKNEGGIIDGLGATPYSVNAAWWKIADAGGAVTFSYSADGLSWTEGATLPEPFPLTAVDVLLGGGTYVAGQAPIVAHFDRLNLAP